MARQAQFEFVDGKFVFPLRSTVLRIQRKLNALTPYKYIRWDALRTDYYIYTVSIGQPDHMSELGPYHYKWIIALADMLNIWTLDERKYQPKVLLADGRRHESGVLPDHLSFPVITPLLQATFAHLDPTTAAGVQKLVEATTDIYRSFGGAKTMASRSAAMAAILRSEGWTVKPPLPDTPENVTVPVTEKVDADSFFMPLSKEPEPGPEEVFERHGRRTRAAARRDARLTIATQRSAMAAAANRGALSPCRRATDWKGTKRMKYVKYVGKEEFETVKLSKLMRKYAAGLSTAIAYQHGAAQHSNREKATIEKDMTKLTPKQRKWFEYLALKLRTAPRQRDTV